MFNNPSGTCNTQCVPYDNTMLYTKKIDSKPGSYILNTGLWKGRESTDFSPDRCDIKGCPENVYKSYDPRLVSIVRGSEPMRLNEPPKNNSISFWDIYKDKSISSQNANRIDPYPLIDKGNITYYVDKEISPPFFQPNFNTTGLTTSYLYKDPMGNVKVTYDRVPIIPSLCPDRNCTRTKPNRCTSNLSFLNDSTFHREDILSHQYRVRNQQKYESRWTP